MEEATEKKNEDSVEKPSSSESYINETLTSNLSIENDKVLDSPLPAVTELDKIIRAGINQYELEVTLTIFKSRDLYFFLFFSYYQQCGRLRNT